MAYITPTEIKAYLDLNDAGDDTLITDLIARAEQAIETHTGRKFKVASDTTRYYTVGVDTDGDFLYLDEDLCSITSVTNDADASSTTALTQDTHYIALPRNTTPYHSLKLLANYDGFWTYTTDPEMGIEVVGKFGYSTTPPNDIIQAIVRLVSYYYRQKDAQVFDVTAIPDAGVIQTPVGIPADVKLILKPYVRRVY